MRKILVFLMWGGLAACVTLGLQAQTPLKSAVQSEVTHDGSSLEKAIPISEITESTGIAAEYRWLAEHYPGYRMKMQSLLFEKGKPYDLLEFVDADGTAHAIYFDISKFFGKM